jgi:glyoxylase-like metal-dependent hydrolase (beta-lactamase superfamily II)
MMRTRSPWFERRRIDDDVTLISEPGVDSSARCNIWHVRGRNRDLLVDTGLGLVSLREAARDLFTKGLAVVATHTHFDHVGAMFEFEERIVHRIEAKNLADGAAPFSLRPRDGDELFSAVMERAGYILPECYLSELPFDGYDVTRYAVLPALATRLVDEGDRVDLGDRSFEVLHLPGHSPGSIGLWEEATGILFSGDAVYDGPLLDELPDSDIPAYVRTMERLIDMPVTAVHGGHEPSFGRDRLRALCRAYLERRRP